MAKHLTAKPRVPATEEVELAMRRTNDLLESHLTEISRRGQGRGLTPPLRANLNELLRCELRDRSIRSGLLLQTLELADVLAKADRGNGPDSAS